MRRYVHGPNLDEIIRQENFAVGDPDEADPPTGDAPTVLYHHHDRLGSVVALTDVSGKAVEFVRYSAFGSPTIYGANATGELDAIIPTSAHGNRPLYTGREWLREASLADHRNRTYSPYLGRWTSTDPIQFQAGDINLYRYVGNGVVAITDQFGEQGEYQPYLPRAIDGAAPDSRVSSGWKSPNGQIAPTDPTIPTIPPQAPPPPATPDPWPNPPVPPNAVRGGAALGAVDLVNQWLEFEKGLDKARALSTFIALTQGAGPEICRAERDAAVAGGYTGCGCCVMWLLGEKEHPARYPNWTSKLWDRLWQQPSHVIGAHGPFMLIRDFEARWHPRERSSGLEPSVIFSTENPRTDDEVHMFSMPAGQ